MKDYRNIIMLDKAARRWDDGLPLGNGRIGAMVMGKVNEETIIINEETLWYGPKRKRRNPDAREHIGEIRSLLREGKAAKAAFLAKLALTSTPKYNNPYQPAGDLRLCFLDHQGKAVNYIRSLDIDQAIASVEYTLGEIRYRRELLVSSRYNVLAVRLTCDQGTMTLSANISRKPFEEHSGKLSENTVGNWGENGVGGVKYLSVVRMTVESGSVHTLGDFVYCENANGVVLYLTAATDFGGRKEYRKECLERLEQAERAGFDKIKEEHIRDYHQLYNRMELHINDAERPEEMTSELLSLHRKGEDRHLDYLTVLLFHYARYLMISSSFSCVLPANLQGIWNGSYEPPWQCEFTININEEMNYWFVEKCNLPECHLPLFDLLDRMVKSGKVTAREVYGCRGFCAHHNTNLWASTDLEGIFDASPFWPMGGAWLSLHLYEHYLFTQDIEFLKERALPVMGEAILFFEDYLYEDEEGYLLTGPSLSTENTYCSEIGEKGALCMAPTMDIMILRQLLSWYLEGGKLTGRTEGMESATLLLKKLPPTRTSKEGRILEWYQDYEETEPGHRHISHMYGLHPGNEITRDKRELFKAAKRTIDYRIRHGGGHTGWSKAWITCFYARLREGDKVARSLRELLETSVQDNMLDMHPPFQIDGNFGSAEAILEALIQSHSGYIDILPALPGIWKKGKAVGIRLRGGMSADLFWDNSSLKRLLVRADQDMEAEFRYGSLMKQVYLMAGVPTEITFEA